MSGALRRLSSGALGHGVVSSTIEIGGRIAAEHLIDLLAAAEEDGALLDGRQAEYDDVDFRRAAARDRPLRFARSASAGEEFVEIEAFCLTHDLVFRRFGDGGASGEAGVVFWEPGAPSPTRSAADARGRVYVTLDEVEASLARGATLADLASRLRRASGRVPPFTIDDACPRLLEASPHLPPRVRSEREAAIDDTRDSR